MVDASEWLDLKQRAKHPATERTRVPVKVESVDSSGALEVTLEGSDMPPVVTSGEPGVWAVGADAVGLMDAGGRITRVLAPGSLPEGATPVPVGTAALKLQEHEERLAQVRSEWQADVDTAKELAESATAKALSTARGELEAAKSALEGAIGGVSETATKAGEKATEAASSAAAAATAAQGAGKKIRVENRNPTRADNDAPIGSVWHERSGDKILASYVWNGTRWDRIKNSHGTLANNAVRSEHILASEQMWAKIGTFAKVTTQMLIAGEARITENLLANKINLQTSIIAGNESGTHTKLDPQGLHVYRRTQAGEVVEAIRLGADDSEDYLGIADNAGKLVSSMDAAGGASFQSLNVAGTASMSGLLLDGVDVGPLLASRAQAVSFVSGSLSQPAFRNTHHQPEATVWVDEHVVHNPHDEPLFAMYVSTDLSVRVEPHVNGSETWGAIELNLRYSDRPLGEMRQPSQSSPVLSTQYVTNQGTGSNSTGMVVPMLVPPRTSRMIVLMVTGHRTKFSIPNAMHASSVIAFGPSASEAALPGRFVAWATDTQYGGYAAPPQKTRYVKTYNPTWGASYDMNRGSVRYGAYDDEGIVIHGAVPGTPHYSKACIGFPNLLGDLSGASIEKVEVYVYFRHWFLGGGGTVGIGYHNALSTPPNCERWRSSDEYAYWAGCGGVGDHACKHSRGFKIWTV